MKLSMPRFDQAPVLVVGDVMLDRYWHGATSRISPEAPVPVVRVEQHEDRPGGAANVALNIAALGAQALLVGVTGRDEAADSLANSLKAAGVDARFQRIDSQPTIVKLRVMSRHQQLLRVDFEEPFRTDAAALAVDVESLLAKVKVLVLSDYGKGALQNHQVLIQAARARNIPILADPKGKDFAIYRGASLITPNLSEFETIVGRCADEAELVAKGQALMSELDLGALLVTRGEHGMTLLRHGQPALHLPARAREVFDVTGAGDTVISTWPRRLPPARSCRPRWAWPTWPPASWSASWVPRRSARPNCVARCSASRVPSVACWAWSNCCWQSKTPAPTARRSSSPMAASTSFTPAT